MSVEVLSFGCRLNLAEGDMIRALAAGEQDLVVINSCAVTAEAVRQTRQAVRRARRERPHARLVVTGCAAEVDRDTFAAMPEVDAVIGNSLKLNPGSLGAREGNSDPPTDVMPPLVPASGRRSRAFVQVQTGCDHRCTFCIIPYARGPSRSVATGAVIERIAALVDGGAREVVLTGVDVTSYGHDLPGAPTLGLLVERILRHVPGLPRLRLSSLDSVEIDGRLEALIGEEPRVMPHLHLSLQAGDDMILKRMKRRHGRADAIALVRRLKSRRPDLAIGADLIAGFPTETDEMAENSLRLVHECDIVHGHVFPYSPRPGTPAARMPQVDGRIVRGRARNLRAACEQNRMKWLKSLVGTRQMVLAEQGGVGHGESFAPVRSAVAARTLAPVAITAVDAGILVGAPA